MENKIAENIERLRNSLGYSRTKIARDLNIPQRTFNNYASGRFEPDADMLIKIANYFGVTLDFLFGNVPEIKKLPSKIETYSEAINFLTIDMKGLISKLPETDVINTANIFLVYVKGLGKTK